MPLSRLIYISRSTHQMTERQLADLVFISADRNSKRNITGALLYCDGYFLQMLEGQKLAIQERYERISLDDRHTNIQLISQSEVKVRLFPNWEMSMLHECTMQGTEKVRFRTITSLLSNARSMDQLGDSATNMLADLKSSIDKQTSLAAVQRAA